MGKHIVVVGAVMLRDGLVLCAQRGTGALAGFCRVLAEAPWTIGRADVEKLGAAGLSETSILHAVVLSSYFNYLNRVADGLGVGRP